LGLLFVLFALSSPQTASSKEPAELISSFSFLVSDFKAEAINATDAGLFASDVTFAPSK
jgi:hypothetical protein